MNQLIPASSGGVSTHEPQHFVDRWLGRLSPKTQRGYLIDLATFSGWLAAAHGVTMPQAKGGPRQLTAHEVCERLATLPMGAARSLLDDYQVHLRERYQPRTINRKLSALLSFGRQAHRWGIMPYQLTVDRFEQVGEDLEEIALRIIDPAAVATILRAPDDRFGTPSTRFDNYRLARDRAVLWILAALALRRFELTGLDLEHVDTERHAVAILGKRRSSRQWIELPSEVWGALASWLAFRGVEPGPLFNTFDRDGKPVRAADGSLCRTTDDRVCQIVRLYAKRATGRDDIRPHDLRRAAASTGLDATRGDIAGCAMGLRHGVQVAQKYDRARERRGHQFRVAVWNAYQVAMEG